MILHIVIEEALWKIGFEQESFSMELGMCVQLLTLVYYTENR